MKKIWLLAFVLICTSATKISTYTKAEIMGDIDPASHPAFEKLKSKHTTKADAYLRNEVYKAFVQMWRHARRDNIDLVIISATRNRAYQVGIWNRKWHSFEGDGQQKAEKILRYSSMPGTSRHHWGTDFDINALNNDYFESGEGAEIYTWMQAHASNYGFFQPYTGYNQYRDAGYREEKWHWSYYPLARRFQRAYNHVVSYPDITGFQGSEYAKELNVINNYVNGIEVPEAFSEN
ncbi:MAG: M15 family metallopeptidase [Owenweeksia sp.]|nr:M15 family metallopeptidase [Owenweeksia sp.]